MPAVDFLIEVFKNKAATGIFRALVKKDAVLKERLQAIPETIQAELKDNMSPQKLKLSLIKYKHGKEIKEIKQAFQDVINRLEEVIGAGLATDIGAPVTDQQVRALLDNQAVASMVNDNPFVKAGFMSPSEAVESMYQTGTIPPDLVADIIPTMPIPDIESPDIDLDGFLEVVGEVLKDVGEAVLKAVGEVVEAGEEVVEAGGEKVVEAVGKEVVEAVGKVVKEFLKFL